MGYSVKWVMDNLGISRKTLRNYEAKGLIADSAVRHHAVCDPAGQLS